MRNVGPRRVSGPVYDRRKGTDGLSQAVPCAHNLPDWTDADMRKDEEALWQADWDDDDLDSEFCQKLKAEIERVQHAQASSSAPKK